MTPAAQIPPDQCAFEHGPTRETWQRMRLRAGAAVPLVVLLLLATVTVMGLLGNRTGSEPMWMRIAGFVCLVAAPFIFALALYSLGPILRLWRMRRILRVYPWQYCAAVRPSPGVRDVMALPVHLQVEPDGEWSPPMRAVNPVQRKRWTGVMEQGAWFAGDPDFGGVIAEPGGRELMTVQHGSSTAAERYRSIARDKGRLARAKRAGLSHPTTGLRG
ncbi:hypothetical protein DSC45_20790 [Streptomyces sp. YIM 130001]|uniref:hypothetical protein n=1 Tax=Streptomyces sp. YIM 130001 TaxID=2259644 RepID=UPI000E655556|nr:hypothetical protein [Streptomyces sp. YIM 130001]RII14795.1 hypothetical protein DSC45_20790 [Streptomyces sp. YIM 130001]